MRIRKAAVLAVVVVLAVLAVLAVPAVLGSCEDSAVTGPPVNATLQAQIDRGRYLVNHVSQCSFCHTPLLPDGTRDLTRFLAGVPALIDTDRMDPDVGLMPAPNLTPDATGIANFTDDALVDAIKNGTKLDGSGAIQVHPSPVYSNMTDDDVRAIVAYLRALPAIANPIPPRQPPWTLMPARPPLDFSGYPMPQGLTGADQDSAVRGRYLVGAAGLCNQCHSPPGNGPPDPARYLSGGVGIRKEQLYGSLPGFPAMIFGANITPDATGIAGFTLDDIRNVFRKGQDPTGQCLCAPTHGSPAAPFAGMTDDDVDDIGRFLLAIPPIENDAAQPVACSAPGFCVP